MNGIILAGGEGMRLRPYTENTPKPMLEVVGKPILHWLVKQLGQAGVSQVILMENYLSDQVKTYFDEHSDEFDASIVHALDAKPNKGTSELVKSAARLLDDKTEDTFIMAGDTLIDVNLKDVAAQHNSTQALATVVSRREKLQHGMFACNSQNRITSIQEKPEVIIPTATMLLKRNILENIDDEGDFFFNIKPYLEQAGHIFEVAPDQVIHVSERRDDLLLANSQWENIINRHSRGSP